MPKKPTPLVSRLSLELAHTNKEGLLETPEGLAAWIGSCLNCNTNRAQVEVTTLLVQPPANALAAPSVPARFTPAQTVLLQVFATAEFAYILELKTMKEVEAALASSGNLLLRYLFKDLSKEETGGGFDDAVVAMEAAMHDIGVIRDAMLNDAHRSNALR